MLIEELRLTNKPQPRFRLWDTVQWHDYPHDKPGVIVGIQWDWANETFHYEVQMSVWGRPERITESDNVKLISRPGLEPEPPIETPRQKADRLKQEFIECPDASWVEKNDLWKEARKDTVGVEAKESHPLNIGLNTNPTPNPDGTRAGKAIRQAIVNETKGNTVRPLEDRLLLLESRVSALEQIKRRDIHTPLVHPIVIGTLPAPDNKDG